MASKKVRTTLNLSVQVRDHSMKDDVNTAIRLTVEALGRHARKDAEQWFNVLFVQLPSRHITNNPSAVQQAQIDLEDKVKTTDEQTAWKSAWMGLFNTTIEDKWSSVFDTDKPRLDISKAVLATIAMWKAKQPEDIATWYNSLPRPADPPSDDCRVS